MFFLRSSEGKTFLARALKINSTTLEGQRQELSKILEGDSKLSTDLKRFLQNLSHLPKTEQVGFIRKFNYRVSNGEVVLKVESNPALGNRSSLSGGIETPQGSTSLQAITASTKTGFSTLENALRIVQRRVSSGQLTRTEANQFIGKLTRASKSIGQRILGDTGVQCLKSFSPSKVKTFVSLVNQGLSGSLKTSKEVFNGLTGSVSKVIAFDKMVGRNAKQHLCAMSGFGTGTKCRFFTPAFARPYCK